MAISKELARDIENKIKEKLAQRVPDVPIDEMIVDIYGNHVSKSGKIILGRIGVDFVHSVGEIIWRKIKLNDLIDANYDILRDDL